MATRYDGATRFVTAKTGSKPARRRSNKIAIVIAIAAIFFLTCVGVGVGVGIGVSKSRGRNTSLPDPNPSDTSKPPYLPSTITTESTDKPTEAGVETATTPTSSEGSGTGSTPSFFFPVPTRTGPALTNGP